MHISVSNFAAILNKLQACATTSTEHFLGSSRKNFSFFIFLQEFFGRQICRSDLKHLGQNLQKQIPDLDSSRKITQFQKTNGSNQSLDVGDIVDLKSAILLEFL